MTLSPRAVVVHRRSELEGLLERHGSRGQAEFFLRSRGRDLAPVQAQHDALQEALHRVATAVPSHWRRLTVERTDLPRNRFDPEDVVIAVGQDGLVANVAKYLAGQPVVGVDPEPGRNPGVLVRHDAARVAPVLAAAEEGSAAVEHRSMVTGTLDDGQELRALNELYAGDAGHQSARYQLSVAGQSEHRADQRADQSEHQSSSGVLVGTGTGATGWCASLAQDRGVTQLPSPLDRTLAWFVREAWPSPATRRTLTAGLLQSGQALELIAESDLVVFGDGLESDRLRLTWGQRLTIHTSSQHLTLVVPGQRAQPPPKTFRTTPSTQ